MKRALIVSACCKLLFRLSPKPPISVRVDFRLHSILANAIDLDGRLEQDKDAQ